MDFLRKPDQGWGRECLTMVYVLVDFFRTVIKINMIKGVARLSSRMFYDDKAHNMRAFFPIVDVE